MTTLIADIGGHLEAQQNKRRSSVDAFLAYLDNLEIEVATLRTQADEQGAEIERLRESLGAQGELLAAMSALQERIERYRRDMDGGRSWAGEGQGERPVITPHPKAHLLRTKPAACAARGGLHGRVVTSGQKEDGT